jgi:hypothetical protein
MSQLLIKIWECKDDSNVHNCIIEENEFREIEPLLSTVCMYNGYGYSYTYGDSLFYVMNEILTPKKKS